MVDELHAVLARPLLDLAFQSRVVMVLDVVICAAGQLLSNLRPTIAKDLVQFKDKLVFMRSPLDFFDVWIKMIVPSKIMKKVRIKSDFSITELLIHRIGNKI